MVQTCAGETSDAGLVCVPCEEKWGANLKKYIDRLFHISYISAPRFIMPFFPSGVSETIFRGIFFRT